MSFSGQVYPNDTVGYFRIASAVGRQPIEPVAVGEFRIGSGPSCQLRLGGGSLPEVHSVLTVETDQIVLNCQAEKPALLLNGSAVSSCELQDGDLVEIGDHRLLFRRVGSEQRITLDETAFGTDSSDSAEDLVDRLNEQLQLVEDLAETPDQNIVELLKAVATAGTNQSSASSHTEDETQTDLQQVMGLLQKHHEASRIRLESLTEVLDNVVKQQKLIADTLEVMSNRIQTLDASSGYNQRRSA